MNKKIVSHAIIITSIVCAVFTAAALTPTRTDAKTAKNPAVMNIAKIDFENNKAEDGAIVIADNVTPLAAMPSADASDASIWWIIIAAASAITGVALYDDFRDRRSS